MAINEVCLYFIYIRKRFQREILQALDLHYMIFILGRDTWYVVHLLWWSKYFIAKLTWLIYESPFFLLYPEGVWTFEMLICEIIFENEEVVPLSAWNSPL